jgi:predicted nucleotidyltransferase
MSRKNEILTKLHALMPHLKAAWHVQALELFGSIARAEDTSESDLDLIVYFEPQARVTFFTLDALSTELEKELSITSDIATPGAIKPAFRKRIEKDIIYVKN